MVMPYVGPNVTALLERLSGALNRLVAQLASAPGTPPTSLWAYTTDRKTSDFAVTSVQLTVANQTQKVLQRNPRRVSFILQPATAGTLYVGSRDFSTNQTAPISVAEFGITGHIGEVWIASSLVPLTVTLIEVWTDEP